MLGRLKDSFDAGVEKIRWFSSLFSERLKVEMAVMKLLKQANDLKKKRDELTRTIGERVFELRNRQHVSLLKDAKIKQAIKELEKLDSEIEELNSRVSDIGKVED